MSAQPINFRARPLPPRPLRSFAGAAAGRAWPACQRRGRPPRPSPAVGRWGAGGGPTSAEVARAKAAGCLCLQSDPLVREVGVDAGYAVGTRLVAPHLAVGELGGARGARLAAPGVLKNPPPVEALYERAAALEMAAQNLLERAGRPGLEALRDEGEARGRARALLTAGERARILDCVDLGQLKCWGGRRRG